MSSGCYGTMHDLSSVWVYRHLPDVSGTCFAQTMIFIAYTSFHLSKLPDITSCWICEVPSYRGSMRASLYMRSTL